jgi:hypothetical protein
MNQLTKIIDDKESDMEGVELEEADSLKKRLARLGEFCTIFEDEGFQFGKWGGGDRDSSGSIEMPYFITSKAADKLVEHCYEHDWVLRDFDWPGWMQSTEAQELRDNPETLAKASPDQLANLLTVLIRQEKFSEGSLASAYDSGLLTGILRRARTLAV